MSTDQTSMVVLREEVFQSRGIKRSNQQRLATEQHARQQRAAQPVQSRRVDNSQPMYTQPRAGHGGGGGAFGWWMLGLMVLPVVRRYRSNH